jgi:hypothetical protein
VAQVAETIGVRLAFAVHPVTGEISTSSFQGSSSFSALSGQRSSTGVKDQA